MKKVYGILLILSLIIITALAWLIFIQPREPQWTSIQTLDTRERQSLWVNDYNFTINQFRIDGDEWRIKWSCDESEFFGDSLFGEAYFQFKVFDVFTEDLVKEIHSSIIEEDENYLENGVSYLALKGNFVVEVSINGALKFWRISIEEYQ